MVARNAAYGAVLLVALSSLAVKESADMAAATNALWPVLNCRCSNTMDMKRDYLQESKHGQ
jgi:hypothetical protein